MRQSGIPGADQAETSTQPPVFIETPDIFSLNSVLATYGDPAGLLHDKDVQTGMANLADRSHDAGKRLFVMDAGHGPWAVVADDLQAALAVEDQLVAIDRMQQRIKPESLRSSCKEVHLLANNLDVGQGVLETGAHPSQSPDAIYPVYGMHVIGYTDVPAADSTVHFDLTAKTYVFSDFNGTKAADAVMQGVIGIDAIGQTTSVEHLYQTDWHRRAHDPDSPGAQSATIHQDKYLRTDTVSDHPMAA